MRILLTALTASILATSLYAPAARAQVWDNGPGIIVDDRGDYRGYHRDRGYGDRRHHDRPVRVYRERDRGFDAGDALVGGAIGLAAGALLGSALSQPRPAPAPTYYPPAPQRPAYVAPPTYEDTIPARTYHPPRRARHYDDYGSYTRRDHVEACFARYRSYDPRTDTFLSNDGYRKRCNPGF